VLVVGGGAPSVGLYAAAIAVGLGAAVVDYLDDDPQRRSVAMKVGASAHPKSGWRKRRRYPITVNASVDAEGLAQALLSTEPGGVCTSVGIYLARTTPIPLQAMYGIGLTFITGRIHASAAIPDVLRLVQSGQLDAAKITTRTARWDEAPEALLDPSAKVVITAP
jgi:alcohol dehydrogenase